MAHRTLRNYGCPFCSNHRILVDFNDLSSNFPDVAREWHPTKNGDLLPIHVVPKSEKKIWWLDQYGHEWKTTPYIRTKGHGCPECYSSRTSSVAENELADFIEEIGEATVRADKKILRGKEIDIYLPHRRIGVEFNGTYWHSEQFVPRNYHLNKWKTAGKSGVQLIQIWEDSWNRNKEAVKRSICQSIGRTLDNTPKLANLLDWPVPKTELYAEQVVRDVFVGFVEKYDYLPPTPESAEYFAVRELKTNKVFAVASFETDGETLRMSRIVSLISKNNALRHMINSLRVSHLGCILEVHDDNMFSDKILLDSLGFERKEEASVATCSYLWRAELHTTSEATDESFARDFLSATGGDLSENISDLFRKNNVYRVWDAGSSIYSRYLCEFE